MKRFQVIVVYVEENIMAGGQDITTKTEVTESLQNALTAASIYWDDPCCESVTIFDFKRQRDVLRYSRPDDI